MNTNQIAKIIRMHKNTLSSYDIAVLIEEAMNKETQEITTKVKQFRKILTGNIEENRELILKIAIRVWVEEQEEGCGGISRRL